MKSNLSVQEQQLIEKEKEKFSSIPRGKREGGRIAKEKVNRFSNLLIQKPARMSWEKKMDLKQQKKNIKDLEKKIKEDNLKLKPQRPVDLLIYLFWNLSSFFILIF